MSYQLDPDLLDAGVALAATGRLTLAEPAARDDWRTLRRTAEAGIAAIEETLPERPEVSRVDDVATSHDGADILVRWYSANRKRVSDGGPAVVYLHGGGMIMGSVDLYDGFVANYVAESGIPMLAVDYRRAPERPYPSPVEDCFAGLRWLVGRANELGVDSSRIGVMGDSAGGGLAAGVALMACDRAIPLGPPASRIPDAGRPDNHPGPSARAICHLVL